MGLSNILAAPSNSTVLGLRGWRKRGDPETIANSEINLGDIFLTKTDIVMAHEFLDGVSKLVINPATTDWMK